MDMRGFLRQISVHKFIKIPDKVLTLPAIARLETISGEHSHLGRLIPLTKVNLSGGRFESNFTSEGEAKPGKLRAMCFEPCALTLRIVGVHQKCEARTSKTPIARRKTSFQQASDSFTDNGLVITLGQRVGLRHTVLSFIMQDVKPITSLLNFTGIVRIEQLDFAITHEVAYAERGVIRILSQGRIDVTKTRIDIQDSERLLFSRKSNHLSSLGVKVITSNKVAPLLRFTFKSTCLGRFVLHDTTITSVTMRVLRVMIKFVGEGFCLGFQVTFGIGDVIINLILAVLSGALLNLNIIRGHRLARRIVGSPLGVNFGASGTRNMVITRGELGITFRFAGPKVGDVIPHD